MSLILEALKKSEANRRLGEAPGLATPFSTPRRRRSALPLLVVLILAAAGGGWWLLRTPAPAPSGNAAAPAKPGAAPNVAAKPNPAPPAAAPLVAVNPSPVNAPAAAVPPLASLPNAGPHPGMPQAQTSAASGPSGADAGFIALPPKPHAQAVEQPKPTPPPVAIAAPPLAANAAPNKASAVANPPPPPPAANARPTPPPANPPVTATLAAAPPAAAPAPPPAAADKTPAVADKAPAPDDKAPAADAPGVTPGFVATSRRGGPPPTGEAAKPHMAPPTDPSYSELPFATRKEIPPLKLAMHVYTPDPASRFVLLNGSRLIEGDKQDDLGVREIRPDGVVLEYKGTRFFFPRDGY